MTCAVLVLSCDKYAWLWDGWYRQWSKHWHVDVPVYFATETEQLPEWPGIVPLYVGKGLTWSQCLLKALAQIPHDTIFFSLEDYWPTQDMSQGLWNALYEEFRHKKVHCLRCSPPSRFYRTYADGVCRPDSPYLVSCQTSFWDKLFLASCAEPEESPWDFEIKGTARVRERGLAHFFAFHPLSWYGHVVRWGKWTKEGRWLKAQMTKNG